MLDRQCLIAFGSGIPSTHPQSLLLGPSVSTYDRNYRSINTSMWRMPQIRYLELLKRVHRPSRLIELITMLMIVDATYAVFAVVRMAVSAYLSKRIIDSMVLVFFNIRFKRYIQQRNIHYY